MIENFDYWFNVVNWLLDIVKVDYKTWLIDERILLICDWVLTTCWLTIEYYFMIIKLDWDKFPI